MICKVFMVLPTESSTTGLSFINSVKDGSQSSSHTCINKRAGQLPKTFNWISMATKLAVS